jgi:hypothetical protein
MKYFLVTLIVLFAVGCFTASSLRMEAVPDWKTIDIKYFFRMAVPGDAIGKSKRQYESFVQHSRWGQAQTPIETFRAEYKSESILIKIEWAPGLEYLDPPEELAVPNIGTSEKFRGYLEKRRFMKLVGRHRSGNEGMWFLMKDRCYAMRFGERFHSDIGPPMAALLVQIWTSDQELAERIFCSIKRYMPGGQQLPYKLSKS